MEKKIIQNVVFLVWLLSLTLVYLTCAYGVTCHSVCCQVAFHYVDVPHHLSAHQLKFWVIRNKASVYMHVIHLGRGLV